MTTELDLDAVKAWRCEACQSDDGPFVVVCWHVLTSTLDVDEDGNDEVEKHLGGPQDIPKWVCILADCTDEYEICGDCWGNLPVASELAEAAKARLCAPAPGAYAAMTEDAFNTRPGRWAAGPVQQ